MAPQVKVSGSATNMGANVMVELTGLSNGQVVCIWVLTYDVLIKKKTFMI